jgi:hypothetical protein
VLSCYGDACTVAEVPLPSTALSMRRCASCKTGCIRYVTLGNTCMVRNQSVLSDAFTLSVLGLAEQKGHVSGCCRRFMESHHVLGAPPIVASGNLSIVYLWLCRYMIGTPGICIPAEACQCDPATRRQAQRCVHSRCVRTKLKTHGDRQTHTLSSGAFPVPPPPLLLCEPIQNAPCESVFVSLCHMSQRCSSGAV